MDMQTITEQEIARKSETIYAALKPMLGTGKTVLCVCGGSGAGKTELSAALAALLQQDSIKAYVMHGDNYPHRIPAENDAQREAVFRSGGEAALAAYLGSPEELDFRRVNQILAQFKAGTPVISMKYMGRTTDAVYDTEEDLSDTQVLILDWTHGNSDHIVGVDIPIFLDSTPADTLEHRRMRNRDNGVDAPFTALVLELEQQQLLAQAHKAKIILSKTGHLLPCEVLYHPIGEHQ